MVLKAMANINFQLLHYSFPGNYCYSCLGKEQKGRGQGKGKGSKKNEELFPRDEEEESVMAYFPHPKC